MRFFDLDERLNMMTKNVFLATVLTACMSLAHAAGIEGKWQTVDDKSGQPKAVVQISRAGDVYNGTIVSLADNVENVCPACSNKRPLIGLQVVSGLRDDGDGGYNKGKIFDPKSGKTYSSKATLADGGNTLKVRGFVGVSLLGRTQTWKRVH